MVNLANRPSCKEYESEDHSLWLHMSTQKIGLRPVSHISRHREQ
jgi:hypothetical protein